MPRSAASSKDAALALPGVHAVLTLDDLAPVMAKRRMMRHSNSGTPLDRMWCFALADGEVSYVGEPVAIVIADSRYIAEDAAALVDVDYDLLPAVADCRKAVAAGCAGGAARAQLQHRRHLQGEFRRPRRRLRQGRACVPHRSLAAPRRRPSDRRPRHPRRIPSRHRRHHGLGLDPEGARPVPDRSPRCSTWTSRSCA